VGSTPTFGTRKIEPRKVCGVFDLAGKIFSKCIKKLGIIWGQSLLTDVSWWLREKRLPGFMVGHEWRIDEKGPAALIEDAKAKHRDR
jgi:hypothetical protein